MLKVALMADKLSKVTATREQGQAGRAPLQAGAAAAHSRSYGAGLGLLGALGLFLGFPNPVQQVPLLALLYPLALAELARTSHSWKRAFRNGLFCGILSCSACLYWVAVPIHDYGYLPWAVAAPTAVALGCYLALYAAAFAAIMHWGSRNLGALAWGLLGTAAWALLEYLKGWVLSGFAWLTLSAAFVPWYPAVQGAALLGAYGLSGVMAGVAVWAWGAWRLKSRPALLAAMAVLALLAGFSAVQLKNSEAQNRAGLAFLLVQGNIEQDQKWDPANLLATLNIYADLTRQGMAELREIPEAQAAAPVVIWPETAMPFVYTLHYEYGAKLRALAKELDAYLLFGAPGLEPDSGLAPEDYPLFNRAHLISPAGRDLGAYEKEHLVPFGEYPPAWINLPFLDFFLAQAGDFTPGVQVDPLRIPEGIALGVLICYETIFPELAQKRVEQGADILVNISNDAWFGRTAAPEQHLQLTAMRAVEQGRYIVRATNTGISSVIDAQGRILLRTPLFEAGAYPVAGRMAAGPSPFFYLAAYLPWLFALLFFGLVLTSGLRQGQG